MSNYRYNPPRFQLYEFDDEGPQLGRGARRWFVGWNGPAAKAAEEVTLAWSVSDADVLVATSRRSYDMQASRLSAAHLAFAGDALSIPARPGSGAGRQHEMLRIAQTAELWSPAPALEIGSPPVDLAVCDGFAIAYGQVGQETVLIAAAGVPPGLFKVRRVTDWGAYGLDATRSYSFNDLSQVADRYRGSG